MKYLFPLVALALLIALPASAAVLRAGDEVSFKATEPISENLYTAGGTIIMGSLVQGDVVAAGGKLLLQGNVSGDVLAGGGNVDILSRVSGDIRVAGGQIVIGGNVGGDVVVAGGTVHLLPDATIQGDIIIGGGRVILEGTVLGDARLAGGDVSIRGLLGGSVEANISENFLIDSGAAIRGNLTYSAPQEATISEGAIVSGQVTFKQTGTVGAAEFGVVLATLLGVIFLGKLAIGIVTALLFVYFFRRLSTTIGLGSIREPGRRLAIGFVFLVIVPVLCVLLLISILGIMLAGIIGLLYGFLLLLSSVFAYIATGALLRFWIRKEALVTPGWTFLGVLTLSIISLVPIAGWIITFVMFLLPLGYIVERLYERFWVNR